MLAFEAVIELELTRRENDRRVTVLFVEMKAVMLVITKYVSHAYTPLRV